MNINARVQEIDALVCKGAIVDAVETFFADNAKTEDFSGAVTSTKAEMVEKMTGFTGAIAKVNGITLHSTLVGGNRTASEYTFDFDMADGSSVLWHEIILRTWNDAGMVSAEEYFKAGA